MALMPEDFFSFFCSAAFLSGCAEAETVYWLNSMGVVFASCFISFCSFCISSYFIIVPFLRGEAFPPGLLLFCCTQYNPPM